MSKKLKSVFVCSECGFESAKWNGVCPSCGQWNTMLEEVKESVGKNKSPAKVVIIACSSRPERIKT